MGSTPIRSTMIKLDNLRYLIKVQTQHGNWNWNEYMRGLANGLIIAERVMSGHKGPLLLKDVPKTYLSKCGRTYIICA